jgi:hypothetical protein
MIDAVEQLWGFVDLTIDMLRLQRIYFRTPFGSPEKKRALDDAKAAEKLVYEAIAKLKKPSLNL